MPVVFNSTMKTPMSSEHRSLTRSRQDESFAKIVDNLLTEGNRRLINRNDQDVFCSLDRELHKKCQLEIEFENNLLRLYREKNIIIKNRNAREKEVQRKKESAMEAASNQEKKRILSENFRKANRKQQLIKNLVNEKNRLLDEGKLAFFCDIYQIDTADLLSLATKLYALKSLTNNPNSVWMVRCLKYLFVNEQPLGLWNDCLDELDIEDIKALKGEWKSTSFKCVSGNSMTKKNASQHVILPPWERMKATSELDKILTALIFLNKSKVKNKVDFQIRGAILRRPYCENPKFASSQDYEVIRLRDLYHNWPLKNNMEQSVSAIIKAELCNYDPSVNWFLEDCPINLGILKAMHATLHFNAILFISVPNEEIISQAVEGHWDNDEVVLELSHSDHALSSIRSFFHEKGCQIYEVKSAFGESIDAQISQLIKDHLVGLRKLEQQMETVECRTDYKADNEENLFITYCASKISQDMLKRFSEILEAISATFVDQLQKVLSKLRHQRLNIVEHLCECRRTLLTYLRRPSNRQALVDSWQKELNAMPLELLEDDVTKAERHLRLHELVFQLRELTEERRDDNLTHLRDFVGHNEWHANERTNLMNNYCLLLQIELDRWQDRNRVVEMFFPSTDDTNEGKLEDQRNQNYYRLPMLKPPGLFTTEQSLSQTADLKAKRRQPPKDELSESKVQTITYTTEDFKTDDETDRPQLLFVTSATLTACEMLPLTHEDATAKAKEVKKVKQSLEKKKAGEKAQRSRGKKDLTPPQPNQYLLGSQLKPKEPELAFLYEIATCALKVVQLRLTEEQTKLGMYVDDNGDPLPCKEELPKSQDTTSSRSTKTVKKVKKTAPTPELIKEPEQSEKPKVEKAIRLNLLKDEAERTALRLQLIRDVGLEILATFQGDVVHFQNEGTQWIDAEYRGFQKSITKLEEYVQEKIERGESLEYRLLIADNDPFYVSQEVVFTPQRLVNLHPFDQVIDGSPQPENDSFGNLSKLVDQFRREAPHGCICEKLFVELMTDKWECDPMELAKAFIVPQGTKSTGLSVVSSVDWRRFIVAAAMRMLNSSSDQMWESLSVLRRTVHEMAKSTLVGLRLPTEEVKKITSSEGVKLDSRVWDLLLSLFEAPGEEGQMVEMDDLMLSLAASGYSSPFDSLVRSLAALQTPALPLPTPQTTQALHNLFNYPEAGQKPKEDFKVSKEVVQKIMDYVQTFIGSKGCFPSDTRLREMELKEAFGGARSTETPIHLLLHQSQFRALCSWMLPYLYFPILPS